VSQCVVNVSYNNKPQYLIKLVNYIYNTCSFNKVVVNWLQTYLKYFRSCEAASGECVRKLDNIFSIFSLVIEEVSKGQSVYRKYFLYTLSIGYYSATANVLYLIRVAYIIINPIDLHILLTRSLSK